MFVGPINRLSVVSFIQGFESGANDRTFTLKLKEFLESFEVYGSNIGWSNQIHLYSEMRNIE